MAFVNEKISDEDRRKYNVSNGYNHWVADHENQAFLLSDGVDRERIARFKLFLNGVIMKICAEKRGGGNPEEGIHISYNVTQIAPLEIFQNKQKQTAFLIKKALSEYQDSGGGLPNCKVLVTFSDNLISDFRRVP